MSKDGTNPLTGESPDKQTSEGQTRSNPDRLPRWELAALVFGDLLTLVIFAAIGGSFHGTLGAEGPFLRIMNTALPFMLAWLLVGMVVGLYQGTALYPIGRTAGRTLVASFLAGPLGVAFRAVWLGRPVSWLFMLVATGFSAVGLVIWRLAWSRLRRLWWTELP